MGTVDTTAFREALRDYTWLLDRGYPPRALLVVVGNRYALSGDQRIVLARGVCARGAAQMRRKRRSRRLRGQTLHVDAYNVLFTLSSYILGKHLFVGTDGFLRDAAEDHGKAHGGDLVDRCAHLIVDTLHSAGAEAAVFYVDSPVSHSAHTADLLLGVMGRAGLRGSAVLTRSADYALKHAPVGAIATSDSAVIDATSGPVVDLARLVLERRYGARFLRLDRPAPPVRTRRSSMSPG